jgi:hypothetical protein
MQILDQYLKTGKEVTTPSCVLDCNNNMGAIELKYQLLNMYLVERKRKSKRYTKLFKPTPLHSAEFYDSIQTSKGT